MRVGDVALGILCDDGFLALEICRLKSKGGVVFIVARRGRERGDQGVEGGHDGGIRGEMRPLVLVLVFLAVSQRHLGEEAVTFSLKVKPRPRS